MARSLLRRSPVRRSSGPPLAPALLALALLSPAPAGAITTGTGTTTGTAITTGTSATTGTAITTGTSATTGTLTDVSCVSWDSCVAVGSSSSGRSPTRPMAQSWNGTAWTGYLMPNPAGAVSGYLYGVSCRAAADCVAVGSSITAAGRWRALAEHFDGGAWTPIPPVTPAGAAASYLSDVSCGLPGSCLAVGDYTDRAGRVRPLAESLAGAGWRQQRVPVPADLASGGLTGLSCDRSHCLAVGTAAESGQVSVLAEVWSAGQWHYTAPPRPAGIAAATGQAAACAGACVMIGSARPWTPGQPIPIGYRLGPSGWLPLGSPAGATALFSGISCTSATWCAAVGNRYGGARPAPVAANWSSAAWHLTRAGAPAGATASFLAQVSCVRPNSCLAVGAAWGAAGRYPIAEAWNGTRWRLLPRPGKL